MILTKEERHFIYCIMLAEAEDPSYHNVDGNQRLSTENGLCWMFKVLFDSIDFYKARKETLPELDRFHVADWWGITWSPNKMIPRIAALKQCIEDTY